MAISDITPTNTAWLEAADLNGNTNTHYAVASPAAGDRIFLWLAWKPYTITSSAPTNNGTWTQVAEFADGSVSSGDSVGSVKVACWYHDYVGGEGTDITLNFSGAQNVGARTFLICRKDSGDQWADPVARTAAWPSQSSGTVNASSSVAIPDGAIVLACIGIRDDSNTFTRTTSSISASPALTWNGNYVERPSSHATTTSGHDLAADAGYRFVTTGHSSTTLSAEATLSAAETGSVMWIVQGLSAAPANTGQFFAMF